MTLPALSENRLLRLATVTAMYVAQGIQSGLVFFAFPAYMAAQGVSALAISSFIGVSLVPWTLKLLYAPFMERYGFIAMGRRRPWVILGTLGGAAGYFAMALVPDPLVHLGTLTAVMVVGSTFVAIQDVATDALTIDVVPLDEQPLANGLMWGGKIIGTAVTTACGVWLLNGVGMAATLVVAGALTLAFAIIPILVRERPGERLLPWTAGAPSQAAATVQLENWAEIGRTLRRVFLMPASLIAAFGGFVMAMNNGFMAALGPVFTVQALGWPDDGYSNMIAVAGLVGGIVGMVGGGLLVRRLGRARAVQSALLVLAVLGMAMGLVPTLWPTDLTVQVFFIGTITMRTLATVAFFALGMALCRKSVAAVQFALYMAITNFGISSGSALFGFLEGVLPYEHLFFVFALIPVTSLTILQFVDLERHVARVKALDVVQVQVSPELVPQSAAAV